MSVVGSLFVISVGEFAIHGNWVVLVALEECTPLFVGHRSDAGLDVSLELFSSFSSMAFFPEVIIISKISAWVLDVAVWKELFAWVLPFTIFPVLCKTFFITEVDGTGKGNCKGGKSENFHGK